MGDRKTDTEKKQKNAKESKIIQLKQSGRTGFQRLDYYDFMGFSNSLYSLQPAPVDGNPFLSWHGKINSFKRPGETRVPTLI